MSMEIMQPPSILPGNSAVPSDISTLLLPHVLFWHPLVQFPLLSNTLSKCPTENCTGILMFHTWPIGQSKGKTPRLLHDICNIVLLVGAIYKCNKDHIIYSTDPRFIKRIDRILPFILLHRTGYTRTFIHCVHSLVQNGLSMQAIAQHISDLRRQHASEMILNLQSDYKTYTGQELTEAQTISLATSHYAANIIQPMPTNDAVAKCCIADFFLERCFTSNK